MQDPNCGGGGSSSGGSGGSCNSGWQLVEETHSQQEAGRQIRNEGRCGRDDFHSEAASAWSVVDLLSGLILDGRGALRTLRTRRLPQLSSAWSVVELLSGLLLHGRGYSVPACKTCYSTLHDRLSASAF